MHSTDACKNIMHESVRYWLIIIGGQLFTGLHDLLTRQEEGGYTLWEWEGSSMAGYLKHPHEFEQRTLCLLESQGFFGCRILPNADFFSVQIREKLVFFEPLSCQITPSCSG